MKFLLIFLLITLIETTSWCQTIPSEIGDIRIEVSSFSFKRTRDYKLTGKTTKTDFSKYYFDSEGTLIEEVHYGKHHNNNLRLLDRVEQYYYSPNGHLTKSKQWDTDYDKNIHHTFFTIYTYDNEGRLVNEVTYNDKDSVFMKFTFEYTENKSITRLGNSQTIVREYDGDKKLISKKQLWDRDTKTNWIIRYSYKENCIVEDFDSYYDDRVRDYSKKKTECYDNGRLVEITEYYIDKDGLNESKTLIYGKNGILMKVELRYYSSVDKKYELVGFIEIKASRKEPSDSNITKRINSQLLDLVVR